jgi:Fungal specific transcription factor domain
MLEQECKSTIPPPEKVEALSKIYFEKVHPIFPVIDQEAYQNLNHADPGYILLQQGICLAASKNFAARQHLIMGGSSHPLSCREFGEALSGAMRISVEMGLVSNKIVMIQGLALMSQFSDNPDGEDLSSQLCSRAIHHVQSLGLHINGHQEDHRVNTLLCCIWAIDRMNAAFNGRPVLMHERDLRKDLEQCFEQQEPCFRLFLQVIELLDKVIELYRPLPASGDQPRLNWEFPAFEDVVLRRGGSTVGTSALGNLEQSLQLVLLMPPG